MRDGRLVARMGRGGGGKGVGVEGGGEGVSLPVWSLCC